MKSYELRLSPAVMQVIKPILYDMSRIAVAQENNPAINPENEPAHIKKMKRSCVHIIYDAMGIPRPSLARRADGELICTTCGRVINTTFDEAACQKIMDAVEVVNQALFFGIISGLPDRAVNSLVSVKATLPDVAQIIKELGIATSRSNANAETLANLGTEYRSEYSTKYAGGYTSMR